MSDKKVKIAPSNKRIQVGTLVRVLQQVTPDLYVQPDEEGNLLIVDMYDNYMGFISFSKQSPP